MPTDNSDKIEQKVDIAGEAGDVTVIGKVVHRVTQRVDESVFKRLGLEQRAGFLLLALLIIAVGIGGSLLVYQALHPPRPERMSGDFRIAVAGFTERGTSWDSKIGLRFAEDLHEELKSALKEIDSDTEVAIWGPHQVDRIGGRDDDERAIVAEEIADDIEADVLVYGWVDTTGPVWKISPEFYINAKNSYEAKEIGGQYNIGTPIDATARDFADRRVVNEELLARTRAMANITAGLTYYYAGYRDPGKFEQALTYFQKAEEVEGWEDREGKQVLYLLIGNAAGKTDDFEMAQTYHQKALDVDPQYARAHLGLASVYYMLALEPARVSGDPTDTNLDLIARAIDTYRQADRSANKPPLSDIPTKVHFGLGQSHFARAYAHFYVGMEEAFDTAVTEFQAVIKEYGDGANPRVRVQAAESHARLGLIYKLSGHPDLAVEEYQIAASLWYDNPVKRALYEQKAQETKSSIGEPE